MAKKKKKKKRRMEEEARATEAGGAPGAGLEGGPESSDLTERPLQEPEPEAAEALPAEALPLESPAPPAPKEQDAAAEEPTTSDRPREDASAPPEHPGLLARLTGWLGAGSQPAAAGVEPAVKAPLDLVEEHVTPAETKEVAIPEAEAVAEPSTPARRGEDLKAEIARLGEELRQKDQELESILEKGSQEIEKLRGEKAEAETKVRALEAQLQEQTQPSQDLQKRVEELTRQLDAKDAELERTQSQSQETAQAREEAKRALSRLRDMEAALKQAEERTRELQAEIRAQEDLLDKAQFEKSEAPSAAPPGETSAGSPSGQAAELYQQAVTPLTVLVASADLLVMDPGLDPSLRETASEMKAQSQALLELIKKYAGPQGST